MTLCNYRLDANRYVCRQCGDVRARPAVRSCPGSISRPQKQPPAVRPWVDCAHRGDVLATLPSQAVGCGCASVPIEVYQCQKHGSPTVKFRAEGCLATLQKKIPGGGYDGLQCRDCRSITGNLVAVTAYFNPQHSNRRRYNWHQFAAHLAGQGIDLLTIEGVREGDTPDLPETDSVRQISFRDVLWQKERLLNLAIQSLPTSVDSVAWLDADLLWQCDDLADRITRALSRWPIVQPWSTCTLLDASSNVQPWFGGGRPRSLASVNRGPGKDAHPATKHPGFAWVARRETLDAIGGLYQFHVTGGADTKMAVGFYGDFNSFFLRGRMTESMRANWLRWAQRAHQVIRGRVGYLDVPIRHLYHGELVDRKYVDRSKLLVRNGYDPGRHVRVSSTGALEWTEHAPPSLIADVSQYLLHDRRES